MTCSGWPVTDHVPRLNDRRGRYCVRVTKVSEAQIAVIAAHDPGRNYFYLHPSLLRSRPLENRESIPGIGDIE